MKDILWYDVSRSLTNCRHLLGESGDDGRCKVVHLHIYDHPTLEWTKSQIRNACFEEPPKFLLQDNGGKFGLLGRPFRVENAREKVWCRSAYDTWLWREMGIRGIPIPYGAPNAAAHMERLIGTLRLSQEYRHVSPSALTLGFEPTSHEPLAFEARVVQSPRSPFLGSVPVSGIRLTRASAANSAIQGRSGSAIIAANLGRSDCGARSAS